MSESSDVRHSATGDEWHWYGLGQYATVASDRNRVAHDTQVESNRGECIDRDLRESLL